MSVIISFSAFQPASITAFGPKVTAFLLGNTSGVSLTLNRVQASNITGTVIKETSHCFKLKL